MNTPRNMAIALVLAAFAAPAAWAARYPSLERCDFDGSGGLGESELLVCLLDKERARFGPMVAVADLPPVVGTTCAEVEATKEELGVPADDASFEAWLKYKLVQEIDDLCADTLDSLESEAPYPLAEVAEAWGLKPSGGGPNFLVRRNVEDVTLFTPPKSLAAATGALVGYSKNFLDESTTLSAEAAILAMKRFDKGDWRRARVPSLSFKRVEIKKDGVDSDAGDIDELTGRYAFHFLRADPDRWGHEFKVGVAYLTDWDFEQSIGALEFDWAPFRIGTCTGNFIEIGDFAYRCGFGLRAEGGDVFDAGDSGQPEDAFFRLGPTLSFQLARGPWTLSLRWTFRFEIEGDAEDSDLFRAALDVAIDPTGHWSFNAAYEDGELPLSLKPTRTLIVGLGVKY